MTHRFFRLGLIGAIALVLMAGASAAHAGTATVGFNGGELRVDFDGTGETDVTITQSEGTLTFAGATTAPTSVAASAVTRVAISGVASTPSSRSLRFVDADLVLPDGLIAFAAAGATLHLDGVFAVGAVGTPRTILLHTPIVLDDDTTIQCRDTNSGCGIDLSQSVDGPGGLTLNAIAGAVTLDGTIGSTTRLGALSVSAGSVIVAREVRTRGTQTWNGEVRLQGTDTWAGSQSLHFGGLAGTGTFYNYGPSAKTLTLAADGSSPGPLDFAGSFGHRAGTTQSFAIAKQGPLTLRLSGTNTYEGTTTALGGTLVAASATALGATSGGTNVISGATLEVATAGTIAEPLTVYGAGVGRASLRLATGPLATTLSAVTLVDAVRIDVDSGSTLTLPTVTGSTGVGLIKLGDGTLALPNQTSIAGTASIAGGSVIPGHAASLGTGALQISAGGLLSLPAGLVLTGNSGVQLNGGTRAYSVVGADRTAGLAVPITLGGDGGLQRLVVRRAISGATHDLALDDVLIDAGSETPLDIVVGELVADAGTDPIRTAGAIRIAATSVALQSVRNETETTLDITVAGPTVSTIAGVVGTAAAGTGAITLLKQGAGALELSGNNTYAGDTEVIAGTLRAAHENALGGTLGVTRVLGTSTLDVRAAALAAESLTFAGGTTLRGSHASAQMLGPLAATGDLIVDVTAPSLRVGAISATGYADLAKVGDGVLEINGASTIVDTTIEVGAIRPLDNGALGTGVVAVVPGGWLELPENVDVAGFTRLELSTARAVRSTATGIGISAPIRLVDDASIETTSQLVIDDAISGAGHALTLDGPARVRDVDVGALLATGTLVADGSAITAATTLQLAAVQVPASTTLTAPTGTISGSVSGAVGNPAPTLTVAVPAGGTGIDVTGAVVGSGSAANLGLEKTGAGLLVLHQPGTYTAGTAIRGGELRITDGGALGAGTVDVIGSTLRAYGTVSIPNAFRILASSNGSVCGTIAASGGSGVSPVATLAGTVDLNCTAIVDVATSAQVVATGRIASEVETLAKTGAGSLRLTHANNRFYLDARAGEVRMAPGATIGVGAATVGLQATLLVEAGGVVAIPVNLVGTVLGESGAALSGQVRISSQATVGVSGGGTFALSGGIVPAAGESSPELIVAGGPNGVVELQAVSTHWTTFVGSGILRLAGQTASVGFGPTTITSGAELQLADGAFVGGAALSASGTGTGGRGAISALGGSSRIAVGTIYVSGSTAFHAASGATLELAASLRATSGSGPTILTASGPGVVRATAADNDGFLGDVVVAAGSVEGTFGGALGSGALTVHAGAQVRLGTSASLTNSQVLLGSTGLGAGADGGIRATGSATVTGPVQLTGAAALQADTGATLTTNGVISGASPLTLQGAGSHLVNGGLSGVGALTMTAPTRFAADIRTAGAQVYNADVTIESTVTIAASTVAGTGAVRGAAGFIGGALRFELSGQSTYAGALGAAGTSLYVTKAGSGRIDIPTGAPTSLTIEQGTVGLGAAGTLGAAVVSVGSAGTLAVGGVDLSGLTQLTLNGGAVHAESGANTLRAVAAPGGGQLRAEEAATLALPSVDADDASLVFDTRAGAGGKIEIAGAVDAGSVAATGVGVVEVSGPVVAATQTFDSRILALGTDDVSLVAGTLTGSATIVATEPASRLVADVADDSAYVGGIGGGQGTPRDLDLVKRGDGTWSLTAGSSSLTRAVAVEGGVLLVDGALVAATQVTVAAGGALGGIGTVPSVTATGGRVSAFVGDVPRQFTVDGALDLAAASELALGALRPGTPGVDYSQVVVLGAVDLDGAALSFRSPADIAIGATVTILDVRSAGAITGTFAEAPQGAVVAGGGWRIDYAGGTGNDVVLTFVGYPPAATSITPASGPTAGGTRVTITGTSFRAGTTVTIGGVACGDVAIAALTQLSCTTGPRAAGTVPVAVADALGRTGGGAVLFSYADPPPPSGDGGGGAVVTATARITQARAQTGGVIVTQVKVTGAGRLAQTAVARIGRAQRTTTYCRATASVGAAGTVTLRCRPTSAMRAALGRGALRVQLTTVFTPRGGGAGSTAVRVVKVPRSR